MKGTKGCIVLFGGILVGLCLALLVGLLVVVGGGADERGEEFRLESRLYGTGELIEISGEEYMEMVGRGESFLVVARMEVCPAEFPVTETVKSFAVKEGVKIYSLKETEFKKTDLGEKVKYLPSVIVVRDGGIADFLDAEADEDLGAYKSEAELLEWLRKVGVEMTEEQKKIYLSYMASIRSELNSEIAQRGMDHLNLQILAALTRLRQICCHPSTFLGNYSGGSGKLELLLEILDDALANGHRVLIFSQFTSMLKIIQDELIKRKMEYFYLDGSTSAAMRLDYVKRYNGGEKSIFLISLKAGGTGLNLTGADTVIHYDPWWNPAVEDQATDRAYRIGQKNTVHVMKLLTKGTIEEKIFKLQEKKKNLSDSVIKSKEVFVNKLTREELNEIFSL